jgi:hypothetical protein
VSGTEDNQKAEFLGGAIAGGCGLVLIVGFFLLCVVAWLTQ